jgi:hypothetical protein
LGRAHFSPIINQKDQRLTEHMTPLSWKAAQRWDPLNIDR